MTRATGYKYRGAAFEEASPFSHMMKTLLDKKRRSQQVLDNVDEEVLRYALTRVEITPTVQRLWGISLNVGESTAVMHLKVSRHSKAAFFFFAEQKSSVQHSTRPLFTFPSLLPTRTVPNTGAVFALPAAFIYEIMTRLPIFVSENLFHPRVFEEKEEKKKSMNSEQAWCHGTKYEFGILMAVSEISYICEP